MQNGNAVAVTTPQERKIEMKAIVKRDALVKLIHRYDKERTTELIEIEIDTYGAEYYNSAFVHGVYIEYLGYGEWLFLDGMDAEKHYGEEE